MFNDFEDGGGEKEGGGRRAASLGVAAVILILLGSGVAAALATVRVVQERREQDVTFADLPPMPEPEIEEAPPPPPPPPPPPSRPRQDRPAGQRPVLDGPPSGIPDERPEEADGELSEATNVGPIENNAEMGEGGDGAPEPAPEPTPAPEVVEERPTAPPPEQRRETIRRARYLADASGCRRVVLPDDVAMALGAQTVRVRVRALVGPDGRVRNATVTSDHDAIPTALFEQCAEEWVFEPATLPDGTPVPYPAIRTFVIRPRTT